MAPYLNIMQLYKIYWYILEYFPIDMFFLFGFGNYIYMYKCLGLGIVSLGYNGEAHGTPRE